MINNNPWDEISAAMNAARQVDSALSNHAHAMARFLCGKLRRCSASDLIAIKKELRDFNMHTGEWK